MDDALLNFNLISAACAFISLINISLLLFYTFFASHGFYVINRFEDNIDGIRRHDNESNNSDHPRREDNNEEVKEREENNEGVKERPDSR